MTYRVRVERDSVNPIGDRLTSFVIEFPRVVLAETVTHRMGSDLWGEMSWCERTTTRDISKNSASSRAIPFERMVKKVMDDPYMPAWTLNQRGMQGEPVSDADLLRDCNDIWIDARSACALAAEKLVGNGIHKQDANRLLEPWAWVTQIVTSSRWDNFFALRCHEAAHPALRRIARMMYLARRRSTPRPVRLGEWHLPFVPLDLEARFSWVPPFGHLRDGVYPELPDPIKFSAARCAWISYSNHDRDGTPEAMRRTFDRLFAEIPVHASPLEHQATILLDSEELPNRYRSNLTGWLQARKLIRHEAIGRFEPGDEEVAGWGIDETALWPSEAP